MRTPPDFIKYRLSTTVLFNSSSEDYFFVPSGEFAYYTNKQLADHLLKLQRLRTSPEDIKQPLCEFRERLLKRECKGDCVRYASAFFSAKKYLQRRFKSY